MPLSLRFSLIPQGLPWRAELQSTMGYSVLTAFATVDDHRRELRSTAQRGWTGVRGVQRWLAAALAVSPSRGRSFWRVPFSLGHQNTKKSEDP